MDCVEAKLRIEPYVTGKLTDDEKGAFETHLEACAECRLDAELTRAAHSEPWEAAAPSAPPDPPPAPPSNSNWTIDSIFGAPGRPAEKPADAADPPPHAPEVIEPSPNRAEAAPAPEPAAEPAPDDFGVPPAFTVTTTQEDSFENVLASDPAPSHETEVELPPMLDDPPPPRSKSAGREISADEDDSSERAAWDFEPADQKDGALPPEGSLFFAEEALGRTGKNGKKGTGSFAKVALWMLGGIVGLGLLGVSVWIALAVRGESSPDPEGLAQHPVVHETPQPTAPTPPSAPGIAPQVTTTQVTATGPGASEGPGKEASETSPNPEATAEGPARRSVEEPPQSSPTSPIPRTAVPPKSSSTGAPKKSAQALAAERTARELASLPTPWRNPLPRPVRPRPVPVNDDDYFAPPPVKPAVTAVKPSPSTASKQVETPKLSGSIDSSAMAAIQRTLAPPVPDTPAPTPDKPQAPAAETAPPSESTRPLDRLHTATLEAEQKADLEALRKLREAWRGQARSSIGPDRARSKRELADCLWAIQTLTSRTADQKAALAAYRDYVLNAPAGGADARTVARMRQLEDALTESH